MIVYVSQGSLSGIKIKVRLTAKFSENLHPCSDRKRIDKHLQAV